jgi:hypothetical protein
VLLDCSISSFLPRHARSPRCRTIMSTMDGGKLLHHLNPFQFHPGSTRSSILSMLNQAVSPKTSPVVTGVAAVGVHRRELSLGPAFGLGPFCVGRAVMGRRRKREGVGLGEEEKVMGRGKENPFLI